MSSPAFLVLSFFHEKKADYFFVISCLEISFALFIYLASILLELLIVALDGGFVLDPSVNEHET